MEKSVLTERVLLQNLCSRFRANGLEFQSEQIPSGNLFSVLNIVDKEVMYCRVLLYLIESCWYSFEKKVLKCCCGNEVLISGEAEYPCDAPCENYPKEGRIDLLLRTTNHIVAIEVKLDAADQARQLIRYKKALEKDFKEKHIHIFYLTKDGKEASDNSLTCKCEHGLCSVKDDYQKISFHIDILNWLRDFKDEIAKDFYEVLKMSKNNSEPYAEYLDLLKESSDYPKIILKLNEALPILFDEIRKNFFTAIADELKSKYNFDNAPNAEPSGKETWPVTLSKDGKSLNFCYEQNFFFRTNCNWAYLKKCVFDEHSSENDSYTNQKAKEAFHIYKLDDSSQVLLDWFYEKDEDKKKKVIEKIAKAAYAFWQTD